MNETRLTCARTTQSMAWRLLPNAAAYAGGFANGGGTGRSNASRNPDDRSVARLTAARTFSSIPYTTTRFRARVTAV